MKTKKFRVFGMALFLVLAAQNFMAGNAQADDLRDWQRGAIEGAFFV
ncbi:MAG: hypothetical protein NVV73_02345 [Cellvibrionaceae bacterium]|nr:hypothetical protein [Cellvibrionaceae bacterium]